MRCSHAINFQRCHLEDVPIAQSREEMASKRAAFWMATVQVLQTHRNRAQNHEEANKISNNRWREANKHMNKHMQENKENTNQSANEESIRTHPSWDWYHWLIRTERTWKKWFWKKKWNNSPGPKQSTHQKKGYVRIRTLNEK